MLFWCCCCIFVRGEKDKEMWCRYGTILRGGDECLCTREGEDSCVGSGCGSGYGTSFYPKSCTSCKCLDPRGSGDIYTEKDKKPRGRSDASSAANADSSGRPSPSSGKNYQPRKPPSNRRASSVDSENADTREDLENYFAWRDHMKETPSMTDEDFNKIIVFAASIVVASILSIGVCCMGKGTYECVCMYKEYIYLCVCMCAFPVYVCACVCTCVCANI